MLQYQVQILLVLLIGLFLFCDSALNYLDLPVGVSQSDGLVFHVWVGILIAQPALLAIWAAFGAEALFIRLPRAVFLVSLVALAVTFGTWLNLAGRLDADALAMVSAPFCQFTVLLLLFWLIRYSRNWRIVRATASAGRNSSPINRFPLRRIFVWQTLMAAVLFAGLFLFKDSWLDASRDFPFWNFAVGVVIGLAFGFFSWPIATLSYALLSDERRIWPVLAVLVYACLVFALALLALYLFEGKLDSGSCIDTLAILVSFHGASLIALLVVRAMGYRLVRLTDQDCVSVHLKSPPTGALPNTRFAVLGGALLLLFLATLPSAMGLREVRTARADDQKWLNLGIKVNQWEAGSVCDVSFLVRKPISDDALTALADSPQLRSVNLGISQIVDRQLQLVGALTSIETLGLNNTQVSDSGLQHLSRLQQLKVLSLQGCPRVSTAGVRKLQTALPDCQIIFP